MGGHGDDADAVPDVDPVAGAQADGGAAEALGPGVGGEDERHFAQQLAAGVVEIVGVVVMGDRDDVYRHELGGRYRRADQLAQDDRRAGARVVAGRVEGRVGEQPQRAVLDKGGRPADQRESGIGAAHAGSDVPGSAVPVPAPALRASIALTVPSKAFFSRPFPTVSRTNPSTCPLRFLPSRTTT